MSKEVMVYFSSGNKAHLQKDRILLTAVCPVNLETALKNGWVLVNWNNVCLIKEIEHKPVEEE